MNKISTYFGMARFLVQYACAAQPRLFSANTIFGSLRITLGEYYRTNRLITSVTAGNGSTPNEPSRDTRMTTDLGVEEQIEINHLHIVLVNISFKNFKLNPAIFSW